MKLIRDIIDSTYPLTRNLMFLMNENRAHRFFTKFSQMTSKLGLEKFLLDNPENYYSSIQISNAAGFNKNGEIPLNFLYYLGFDRVVIGTVCAQKYSGNPEPNIKRFKKVESIINWMGLPGKGVQYISDQIKSYNSKIPITINLAPTPNSEKILDDLAMTIWYTKDISNVDRYELNISCPNTNGIKDYKSSLKDQIQVVQEKKREFQEFYIKISPDLEDHEINAILEAISEYKIKGITCTNSTRFHDPRYIKNSPEKGGASGNALYEKSLNTQKIFYEKIKKSELKIIACGGINSKERLLERINSGASEIQIFAPLIFKGPKLIRELKTIYFPNLQSFS